MYVACPIIDQRAQVGADGRPPEDGNMDCVPASLASMAAALLRTPQNADAYHDDVYGQGYVGLQNPQLYVPYLAAKGLKLIAYTGTPADLLARALATIRSGKPVLLSIPSDWNDNPPTSQFAHMVAGCDVDSTHGTDWDHLTLTAMNPWTAAYQTQTLNWWQERLAMCAYKAMWVMEGGSSVGVPTGWRDDGTTMVAPNGVQVVHGFRAYILGHTWDAGNVPLNLEYHADPVSPAHPEWLDGQRQDFRDGSLVWLKQFQDRGSFAAENGADFAAVAHQLADAKTLIAQLEAELGSSGQPGYPQYKAAVQAMSDAIKVLTANG